jgi:hypothetical protein
MINNTKFKSEYNENKEKCLDELTDYLFNYFTKERYRILDIDKTYYHGKDNKIRLEAYIIYEVEYNWYLGGF